MGHEAARVCFACDTACLLVVPWSRMRALLSNAAQLVSRGMPLLRFRSRLHLYMHRPPGWTVTGRRQPGREFGWAGVTVTPVWRPIWSMYPAPVTVELAETMSDGLAHGDLS